MLEYFRPECDLEFEGFKMYKEYGKNLIITRDDKRWELDSHFHYRIIFKKFGNIPVIIFVGRFAFVFKNDKWKQLVIGSNNYIYHNNNDIYFYTLDQIQSLSNPHDHYQTIKLSPNIHMKPNSHLVNVSTNEIFHNNTYLGYIEHIVDDSDYIYAYVLVTSTRETSYWIIIDKKSETSCDLFIAPYVFNVDNKSYCIHPATKQTYQLPLLLSPEAKTWWQEDLFYVKTDTVKIYGTFHLDRLQYLSSENKHIILHCIWSFGQSSKNLQPNRLSYYVPKSLVLNIILPNVLI